jgi:Ser/Thr protein kinase RdoA (MazF antagonist)
LNLQTIVEQLKLGEIIGEATPLTGGALHSIFKLKTSSGEFAIKQLNPHITSKEHFQKSYELSETIAERMFKAKIPAVCSLSFEGNHVIQIDKTYFIIYPFIAGRLLDDNHLTLRHAECIGALYASMHQTELQLSEVDTAHYDYFKDNYWEALIRKAQNPSLSELLPFVMDWNQAYLASIPKLKKEFIVTHRDMHSKNVLWNTENQPHIVDWESAGLMNPMLEVIGYGLEWSGIIVHHKVNSSFFEKLISTYFQNLTLHWQTAPQDAFIGWLGHCVLAWTEFNIRRMVGEVSVNKSEISKGQAIIEENMVPCLHFIKKNEHELINLIKYQMRPFKKD